MADLNEAEIYEDRFIFYQPRIDNDHLLILNESDEY